MYKFTPSSSNAQCDVIILRIVCRYTRTLTHHNHFYAEEEGSYAVETSVTLSRFIRFKDPKADSTSTINNPRNPKIVLDVEISFKT